MLKPCYMPCIIQKLIDNNSYEVYLLGDDVEVKRKDVIPVKLPIFQQGQLLKYYHEKFNEWIFCELLETDEESSTYNISFLNKGTKKNIQVPFNTLKLRPLYSKDDFSIKDKNPYVY